MTNTNPPSQNHTLVLVLAMLGFLLVLYLPFLSSMPLIHEEPRRALIARTMMQSGEYFVPMLMEQFYLSKPPLYNWLIALFSAMPGEVSELTARLPSLVFLFLIAVFFVVGLKSFLAFRTRVFLGFSVLLTPELIAKTNLAEIDVVFTFFVTASVWTWYLLHQQGKTGLKLWLLPLCIVALAYLTKREPSIVFFYLGIAPYLFVKKQFRELFSPGHILSVVVMLAIIGGWIWVMIDKVGIEALLQNLQAQVISRGITSSIADYIGHISSYPLVLFVALFPFSILLLVLFSGRVRAELKGRYPDMFLFALIMVLANLPLYWLRGDAAARYFLPMFPTALVLAAMVFESYTEQGSSLQSNKVIANAVKVCSVLILLLALAVLGSSFIPFTKDAPALLIPWYLVLLIALGLVAFAVMTVKKAFTTPVKAALPVLLGIMVLVKLLHVSAYLPYKLQRLDHDRNGAIAMADMREHVRSGQAIQVVGPVHFSLFFYAAPGELRVPKHFTPQYTGYAMGYENTPGMKQLLASDGWTTLHTRPYRGKTLVLGEKR